jgi:TPR repeat protein
MLSNQGFGIPVNRQEAARVYRVAAGTGDAKAEYFLGRMLEYGYGMTAVYRIPSLMG